MRHPAKHVDGAGRRLAIHRIGVDGIRYALVADRFRIGAEMQERLGIVGRKKFTRLAHRTVEPLLTKEELVIDVGDDADVARSVVVEILLGLRIDVSRIGCLQQHGCNQRIFSLVVDIDRPVRGPATERVPRNADLAFVHIWQCRDQIDCIVDARAARTVALRPGHDF